MFKIKVTFSATPTEVNFKNVYMIFGSVYIPYCITIYCLKALNS